MSKFFITAAAVLALSGVSSAGFIASWDTRNAVTVSAETALPELDALDLMRGTGLQQNPSLFFNSDGWTTGDLNAAVQGSDYLSFGLALGNSFEVNLTSLDIRVDRSNSGPDDFALMLWGGDLDSSTIVLTHDFQDSGIPVPFLDVDLSALGTLRGDVEFRLYAFNSENEQGLFEIESFDFANDDFRGIVLNGELIEIPSPGAIGILCLAAIGARRSRIHG